MRFVASLIPALALTLVALVATPPASAGSGSPRLDGAERGLIKAINRQRARAGLHGVRASRKLNRAADFHSREMLYGNYFAHPSLNGNPMQQRVRSFSRSRTVGENLAMLSGRCKRRIGGRVVRLWMGSGGHRAVLLSSSFRRVGVARRASGGTCMITADFASRR